MDSLIFELQIVLYFQLFLSANVRHTYDRRVTGTKRKGPWEGNVADTSSGRKNVLHKLLRIPLQAQGELKPACILLLEVTVTFFTCPDLLPLQNQLYLCRQSKNHITHQSEQTCALIKFSRKKKASKLSQDHFSIAQVIIVRVFFIFHYIVCFPVHCESFCSL